MSNDRYGWFKYYANRFNQTEEPQAANAAMWYLFMHLADEDEPEEVAKPKKVTILDFYNLPNQLESLNAKLQCSN